MGYTIGCDDVADLKMLMYLAKFPGPNENKLHVMSIADLDIHEPSTS